MLQIYQPLSLDLPTIVYGFTYCHLSIYLPSFRDLPTIAAGFTYCHSYLTYRCLQFYLLSSPDLPTVVSVFTYRCLWIYLPFSPNLSTIVSALPTISSQILWPSWWSKENSYGDHFLILPWWSFSDVDNFLYSLIFISYDTKQLCHSINIYILQGWTSAPGRDSSLEYRLSIYHARPNDTGTYTCVSPFQKEHAINIIVKEVRLLLFTIFILDSR